MKLKVLTATFVALAILVLASPAASAKWHYGNGPADLDITELGPPAPPGQVCTTHIEGRTGLNTSDDPAVTPPPPGPYPSFTVELFTGPPGSLDGANGVPGGIELQDGNQTVLPPITSVTTAPAQALNPAEEYLNIGSGGSLWEYAAAPFSFALAPGVVAPGNEVALRQGTHFAIITLTATTCAPPPPITATIDVLPGISPNFVAPSLRLPVLPVRVFGSANLDVTKIDSVKLGNAPSVAIPPALARLFAPKDRNGDGLLDRDYLFVPAATGIACGATSVNLTGTLTGGGTFSGTDSVRTICR